MGGLVAAGALAAVAPSMSLQLEVHMDTDGPLSPPMSFEDT